MTNLPALTGASSLTRRKGGHLALRQPSGSGLAARPLGEQVAATLQAAARSERTRRVYELSIALFLSYLGQALGVGELATPGKDGRRSAWAYSGTCAILRHIEPGHVDGYRAWRAAQGDAPNTASNRAAAVGTFLSVCYRDGVLADRQALSMGIRPYKARQKRDVQPTGRRLSKDEARALRDACDVATHKGQRDLAILDLGLYAGLRCDEVATLDLADLRQDGGRWWLVFSGKGSHTRRVKVHDTAYASLATWLRCTGRELGQGAGPVFASVNKGDVIGALGLGTAAINRLTAEYGHLAGLAPLDGQNRLSPHDLRRTCARNAYDNGAPLPLIQRMLGHADVSTTMRYVGVDDDHNGGAIDFVRY
jgi:integrase